MNKAARTYPNYTERAAYQLLPCGILWTDNRQKIIFINDLLSKLLGYSEKELVGERRFYDLLSVGGKLFFETQFSPSLVLDGDVRETNFEMIDKAGIRHPVVVNVTRSPLTHGGFIYVVFPARNRKKYELELKQARLTAEAADLTKSAFISTMSHEIRTPLHAILEAGNFLVKDNPRSDQLEFIQVLRSAGKSLLNIVNDILDISKLEAGMITLDERPMHADQLVKQVMDTFRPTCRKKGILLRSVLSTDDIPLLLVDGGKLVQVLNNLVSNAVKFTVGGEIVIGLDYEATTDGQHQLDFSVKDSGIGIAPERLKHILEPFVQANETTQADYGGTGLGLSICKKILQAYGADLQINSKPGEGSEFYFTLILEAASKEQQQVKQQSIIPAEKLAPLNHLRALNVDDNRSNLLINARYFSEWKLPYDQVSSGREALDLLAHNVYDIVLLDLRMPKMDGYELARQIRTHPISAVNEVPLIALSASASREVNARMMEAGINGLVVKPFEPAYLHRVIREYGENGRTEHRAPPSAADGGAVDFSQVLEIFAGDEKEYIKFVGIIKDDVVEAKQILTDCANTFSQKDFGDLRHNLISTMRVFALDELATTFEAGKVALEANDREQFRASIDRLLAGLDAFEAEVLRVLEAG